MAKGNGKTESVKVVKTAARKMRVIGETEGGDQIRKTVAPAEYAVKKGDALLAIIVKAQDGWRCCKPTEHSKVGLAVSPIGLDTWGGVKAWAVKEFA